MSNSNLGKRRRSKIQLDDPSNKNLKLEDPIEVLVEKSHSSVLNASKSEKMEMEEPGANENEHKNNEEGLEQPNVQPINDEESLMEGFGQPRVLPGVLVEGTNNNEEEGKNNEEGAKNNEEGQPGGGLGRIGEKPQNDPGIFDEEPKNNEGQPIDKPGPLFEVEKHNDEGSSIIYVDKKYLEFYLDKGYCFRGNRREQYYAKDLEGNDVYWTDPTGDDIYAIKQIDDGDSVSLIEFPASSKDGTPNYIYEHGIPRYPENVNTHAVILPVDPVSKDEYYLPNNDGRITYPRNQFGTAYYAKTAEGDDIPLPDNKYASNSDGTEIYPKFVTGDQYYLKAEDTHCEIGALMKIRGEMVPYYATRGNGDEYYPRQWLAEEYNPNSEE